MSERDEDEAWAAMLDYYRRECWPVLARRVAEMLAPTPEEFMARSPFRPEVRTTAPGR